MRELVAEVAAAYLRDSRVTIAEIPQVISTIAESLGALSNTVEENAPAAEAAQQPRPLTPAQIKSSIRPDAIISFEDGRPYKTLTRHLAARGLTPTEYIAKWGLPPDYPMIAADYSASRAELARQIRLGERGLSARAAARRASARPEQPPPFDNGASPAQPRTGRKGPASGRKGPSPRKRRA